MLRKIRDKLVWLGLGGILVVWLSYYYTIYMVRGDRMKLWTKINWLAAQPRRALKLKMEANLWQEWPEQDVLKENGAAAPVTPTDRANVHALMVWSDDGGTTA